jgi:predicted Zn-dependent protease
LLYPQHPQAAEFLSLAATNLEEFQDQLQRRLTGNAIANALVGTLGFALTGGLFGPLSAVQTTMMMLQGETAVGNRLADRAREQLPLVEDEAVTAYINEVGQRMAAVTGRDDFTYEFYVVRDPRLNAFALPGGKVFVNAGAILESNSEAELAGLLAHELSHAVLSHGFQLMTSGNLTANLLQWVPYGGLATNLAVMSYSRDMERQADGLGTRMLVSAGYAADGLHNLMVTLDRQDPDEPVFSWLSSHPDNEERIRNLETVIDRSGYNRFAFEGVERHQQMQQRVQQLIEKQWPSAEPETAPSAQPSDP